MFMNLILDLPLALVRAIQLFVFNNLGLLAWSNQDLQNIRIES